VFRSDREVIADELERGMPMLSSPTAGCGSIPELSVCPRMMAPPILGLGWSSAGVITLCCQSHRLSYDHNGATAARRKWGHANGYAHCPTTGLWPSLDVLPAEERKATAVIVHAHTLEIHSPSMPTILARWARFGETDLWAVGCVARRVVLRPILTLQAASVGVTPNAATASQQTQQIEASHHYDDSPSEAAAL